MQKLYIHLKKNTLDVDINWKKNNKKKEKKNDTKSTNKNTKHNR